MEETDIALIPGIVERLRKHARSLKPRSIEWRREQLQRLRRLLTENRKDIGHAVKDDLSNIPQFVNFGEIGLSVQQTDLALANLEKWMAPEQRDVPLTFRPAKGYMYKEPLGTVLILSPWNYPFGLLVLPLVGALAAGNTVVLKPSEISYHTAAVIKKLFDKYFEPDVIQTVLGGANVATALLNEHFDHIFYTGGPQVAKIIMAAAAKHLTPVTLELGGKSPAYVDKTANLDATARRIASFKHINCGQTCVAPDYVLVHEEVKDKLVAKIKELLVQFYGEDASKSPSYSRIINSRHTSRLANYIETNRQYLVHGGRYDIEGRFVEPTVFLDPPLDSNVMQEELFGPILPIITVRDMHQAIDIINSKEKPLALYIFTEKNAIAETVIASTSSGGVCVNSAMLQVACYDMEFGGVGMSGMGAYNGRKSFDTFSHRRCVLKKPTWPDPPIMYPPFDENRLKLFDMVADGIHIPVKPILAALAGAAGIAFALYQNF